MSKRKIASMEIWNRKFYMDAVLSFMDSIAAKNTGLQFARYNRMRYVVGELLQNRIEKAYPGETGMIKIELFLTETYFEVSIQDKGVPTWVDFSYEMDDVLKEKTNLRNYILDLWMDEIGIEKLGKDGQRIFVRMNILSPIAFTPPEPYPEMDVLDTNISIRPVETEEDAIEAIRCIYSEYGYSYSYERLYYVDSLLEMVKNKELLSFLAVNEHGQTAGHFALVFSDTFKNMPEISTVVIRKEFRGLGLFSKFMNYCMELGKKNHFRALMGQPVGFHPMSQKAFLKSGFTATSVLLSYIGSDVESEYNKDNQRLDLFASVKILDENAHSSIYPPEELHLFLDNLYGRLDWSYEFGQGNKLSENTTVRIENNNLLRVTKILLKESAKNLKVILDEAVKDALRRKDEMIELMICLNNPSCSYGYTVAKQCNFILSGVIPGGEAGDYLVMQMLIGRDSCYDQLVTVGEFEELKQDIIALNHNGKE